MASTIILALGIYPILDLIAGTNSNTNPLEEGKAFDFIVHLHGLLTPLATISLIYVALTDYSNFIWIGAISVGLSNGA